MVSKDEAMSRIITFYLGSGDFNGLPIGDDDAVDAHLPQLVSDGLAQVVSERDFPNPHIRPWAPTGRRDPGTELTHVLDGSLLGCAYPTPTAMASRDLSEYADRPYLRALAAGAGALDLAFFDLAVLEDYRNDPRYRFDLDDFGVTWGISDATYLNDDEPQRDKILSIRAGFAYRKTDFNGPDPIKRYVCASLRDLSKLTPVHQARMKTWERDDLDVEPHPIWYAQQLGERTDYIGPFEKILGELAAINEVSTTCFGRPLFRKVDRPRAWGWVLRPATPEWDQFAMLTDQLLSDNLDHKTLDAMGAPDNHESPERLGTLNRLEQWFQTRSTVSRDDIAALIRPFRVVRKARQGPAHAAAEPSSDAELVRRQRDMLTEVAISLEKIRRLLAKHKTVQASGWTADEALDKWLQL